GLNDTITLQGAASILKLKSSVARALLERSGVSIQKTRGRDNRIVSRKIKRIDVLRMAARNMSDGDTAKFLGTLPRHVHRRVSRLGVRRAVTLEPSGAVFYYRREIFGKCGHLSAGTEALPCGKNSRAVRRRVAAHRKRVGRRNESSWTQKR